MWRSMRAIVALLATIPYPASSARLIQSIMRLEGTCEKFEALGVSMSPWCLSSITSTSYSDGRADYNFGAQAPDGTLTMITFAGRGSGQVKQDHDIVVQPIDHLIINFSGNPEGEKAVGSCRFDNPYKPASFVTCVAETADGHYEANFVPNGSAPKVSKFAR